MGLSRATLLLVLLVAWGLPAPGEAAASEREVVSLVFASAAAVQPLEIGGRVPAVDVRSVDGERVSLRSFVGESPLAIVFYRGGW